LVETRLHLLREAVEAIHEQTQLALLLIQVSQALPFLLEVLDAGMHLREASLEVLLLDQAVGVGVDQAGAAPAELLHLGVEGGSVASRSGRRHALAVLGFEALGLLQEPADLRPDRRIQAIHPQLAIRAHARATPAGGVGARAAVIRVAGIIGPPVVGVATLGTHEQALQQIAAAFEGDAGPPPILRQLLLGCGKGLLIHERGHGDGDPLCLGHQVRGVAPP
jgi:hypothetical protein